MISRTNGAIRPFYPKSHFTVEGEKCGNHNLKYNGGRCSESDIPLTFILHFSLKINKFNNSWSQISMGSYCFSCHYLFITCHQWKFSSSRSSFWLSRAQLMHQNTLRKEILQDYLVHSDLNWGRIKGNNENSVHWITKRK